MRKIFVVLVITFLILLIINISWIGVNLYYWIKDGAESIIQGTNLLENIYLSIYVRWILLADIIWLISAIGFMFGRKQYKTNSSLLKANSRLNDLKGFLK